MNTKIRIGIWIVAFFLVFSGIGLSSRKAFAASGFAIQRSAFISVYPGYAMATVYAGIPSGAALVLHNALRDIAPTSLSVNEIDEFRLINAYSLKAITPQFAVLPSGAALVLHNALRDVTPPTLSAADISGYSKQFQAHNSAGLASSVALSTNESDESRLLDNYRWQAIERFYTSYGGR